MKSVKVSAIFAGVAAAHSGVLSVTFDGTNYPARDARFDPYLGVKRIEWKVKDVANFPWMAVTDVLDPSITCGLDAQPPELKAVARAGSEVSVQWSGIVRMHQGPVMSYLGPLASPNQKPQQIKFFKVSDAGYDKSKRQWANEDLIKKNYTDTFKIPSDIKPGSYVLRTELLALHGNSMSSEPTLYSGPQFYTHCFNVDITGSGTNVPEGVTFPGGYKRDDPGVKFRLMATQEARDNYVIPGPKPYVGKYEAPVGPKPVVEAKDTGAFPPEFEAKYREYKLKADKSMYNSIETVNGVKTGADALTGLLQPNNLVKDRDALRAEGIKLGLITP
jgi:lytic cellulose monooxygenase (C1-hydroxylating)